MARQLLGSDEVVLMEDGAVIKKPVVGGKLAWHQDYAYWPLATPPARHVLDRARRRQRGERRHAGGGRAPTSWGRSCRSSSVTAVPSCTPSAPASARCGPRRSEGLDVVGYELKAGECGFHQALLWHASGPNTSQNHRRGFIPRYVAGGTTWLGAQRFPYNYTDAELECAPGEPIHGPHFPRIETAF